MPRGKYNLQQQVYLYDKFVKTKSSSKIQRRFRLNFPEDDLPARITVWELMKPIFMQLTEEEKNNNTYFQQDSAIAHTARASMREITSVLGNV
ncbi:hypothetical protein C0J52_10120 [Blattella germanica]|nr:hypothetical protein C0J52_10120 [Blattella germanica]